jgi:hypothetical protein
LAFTYLQLSDQTKYDLILASPLTQQSLKNNQYPKTITKANNVLSNHNFKIAKSTNKNSNKNLTEQAKCKLEHYKVNLSIAQIGGKCCCCGKAGHKSLQCPFKDKPMVECAINKSQQTHAQASKQDGN